MLCKPLGNTDPMKLVASDRWAVEPKVNGKRLLIDGTGDNPVAYNKEGDRTVLPLVLRPMAEKLVRVNAILDGELIGNIFYPFDMPQLGTTFDRSAEWRKRRLAVEAFVHRVKMPEVKLLPAAGSPKKKQQVIDRVWAGGFEGIVFKRVDSRYEPGQRTGSWTKWKNVRTVDCVIAHFATDKHSMDLAVYHPEMDCFVLIGSCSRFEGDAPKAKLGDVIEVAYLNAGDPDEPTLNQAHAKKLRDDKKPESCLFDQLDGTYLKREVPS